MFKSTSLYYEESGKVPPAGPIITLLIGSLTAIFLSFIYAYAVSYIPFIYLNFILTGFIGLVVGVAVVMAARWGKIRNIKVVIGLAVLVALLACYVSWVVTVHLWLNSEIYLFNPSDLWAIIQLAAQEGVWTLRGSTPTGAALYAVWGIEAAVIIGVSAFGAITNYSAEPFCENCNQWTTAVELTSNLQIPEDFDVFVKGLESKNYAVLTELRNTEYSNPVKMKVDLLDCSSCSKVHYLSITLFVKQLDEDGKEEITETVIIGNLFIDGKTQQELMDWKKKLKEKPIVSTAATELEKPESLDENNPLDV